MPWVQLIGMFVNEAGKPVHVYASDASQYELQDNSGPIIFGALIGVGVVGGLLYWAFKK